MTRSLFGGVRPLLPLVLASVCVECVGGDYSIGGDGAGGTQPAGGLGGRAAGSASGEGSGESNGGTGGEGTPTDWASGAGGQPGSVASGGEGNNGGGGANNGGSEPDPGQGGANGGTAGGSGGAGDAGAGCTPRLVASCLSPSPPRQGNAAVTETPARVALEEVTMVNAVNNRDQIVGAGPMGCGGTRALLFDDGETHSLLEELDHTYSEALGINDHGTVIGRVSFDDSFDVTPDPADMVPFIWRDGVTLLLTQEAGLRPVDVNNREQILLVPEGPPRGGFLWEDGELTDLAVAARGRTMRPQGMNNLGQVVGNMTTRSGVVGFLWDEGTIEELPDFRSITVINDAGQMAGVSFLHRHTLLWDGASLRPLGGPDGPHVYDEPVAISADGAVLGPSYVYAEGAFSPLTGRVRGVNITWTTARDLNDKRLIVGKATAVEFRDIGGSCHMESCEVGSEDYGVMWSHSCVGECCGQGEGGAGGAGEPEQPSCDPAQVTSVPMLCPQRSSTRERPYEATALGFLDATGPDHAPRPSSNATGINATGQVTGTSGHCDDVHAFLFSNGVMQDLGTPGVSSVGHGINDQGVVVGMSSERPALWKQGELTLLSGLERGWAKAINNFEQIVGRDHTEGFLWQSGVVEFPFGASSLPQDINNLGQVVGSVPYLGEHRAFVYHAGVMTYLPHLFGNGSEAFAINDRGQVVGYSYDNDHFGRGRAVLWDQGVPVDITPPTDFDFVSAVALDINEAGVVIGSYQEDGPRQNSLGYVYDHGAFVRLEGPVAGEFDSLTGFSINARGEIAGHTSHPDGAPDHARVWSRGCFDACCGQ